MTQAKLLLASASPRRRELLAQIGLACEVQAADIDEAPLSGELPAAYVERLAREKTQAVGEWRKQQGLQGCSWWLIGSDTSVICDQHILGKPEDEAHFKTMMQRLSGREHQVLTAFAILQLNMDGSERLHSEVVSTTVRFRDLSEQDIACYWRSGEPQDKAGGYGIQGLGARFVTAISGSYSSVVGLPLSELAMRLEQMGYDSWHD